MNIISRWNFLKQFQFKRLSHVIDRSLFYTATNVHTYQQQQRVKRRNHRQI